VNTPQQALFHKAEQDAPATQSSQPPQRGVVFRVLLDSRASLGPLRIAPGLYMWSGHPDETGSTSHSPFSESGNLTRESNQRDDGT
jgi:hypothetical protein